LPVGPWRAEDPVVAENLVATTMESMAFIGFPIVEQYCFDGHPTGSRSSVSCSNRWAAAYTRSILALDVDVEMLVVGFLVQGVQRCEPGYARVEEGELEGAEPVP
jgi:hypothetical protein